MTQRRNLHETRSLLLETAASMIADDGISVSLDSLSIIDVCREAGFKTAGSAYKIWPKQGLFRLDLLRFLLAKFTSDSQGIEQIEAMTFGDSPDPKSLTELVKAGAAFSYESWQNTHSEFVLYLSFIVLSKHENDTAAALGVSDTDAIIAFANLYDAIATAYDREFVPPHSSRGLAVTLSALLEGTVMSARTSPELASDVLYRPTGDAGELEPWTVHESAVDAIVQTFTRPKLRTA